MCQHGIQRVVTTTVANFYASKILINKRRSCDITYVELFHKLVLMRENLYPFKWDSNLPLRFCRAHGHIWRREGHPNNRLIVPGGLL